METVKLDDPGNLTLVACEGCDWTMGGWGEGTVMALLAAATGHAQRSGHTLTYRINPGLAGRTPEDMPDLMFEGATLLFDHRGVTGGNSGG